MSTHARIGIVANNRVVTTAYIHFDGGRPVAEVLLEKYNKGWEICKLIVCKAYDSITPEPKIMNDEDLSKVFDSTEEYEKYAHQIGDAHFYYLWMNEKWHVLEKI